MKVQITDTILRDAHQSLLATRMRTEDMLPALELLDDVGYWSLEMWGGATFDVCMRFLDENPWERLRTIRKHVKHTRLQMLLRGQNLVGYRHYADDVVDAFVAHARENGIDVFRIFDALNDIRNLQQAMRAAKKVGGLVEGTISYTVSPVHSIAGFVDFARQLKSEGADLICVKDMAGMITPVQATELITALKTQIGLPVHLHTHCSSGMAPATYLAAAQAGVDILDCALSPLSWGTSQPPTESIVGMFIGTEWETGLDLRKLALCADHFEKVRQRYMPILDLRSERVDTRILHHQTPGGMMSNLLSQLKTQKAEDKFNDVMAETARVRKDLGYPPLVTPTSQIVGTQAVFNVVLGERYKMITREVQDYVGGLYGRAPAVVDPDLIRKVLGDKEPITCRPADNIPPEMDSHLQKVKEWDGGIEQALSYALFPSVATEFFNALRENRKSVTAELPPEQLVKKGSELKVEASPDARELVLESGGRKVVAQISKGASASSFQVILDGAPYTVNLAPRAQGKEKKRSREQAGGDGTLRAPMPGTLLSLKVAVGDMVKKGQIVAVLEAMKMQNELQAPVDGRIKELFAKERAVLESQAPILEIEPVKAD